jgi:hypothetical protein
MLNSEDLYKDVFSNEDKRLIDCVGVDNLRHVCLPWADQCLCGQKIKHNKRFLKNDYHRYACYECTY